MPKQNRVTPFSTLIAASARGTLTGNRGCLHDDHELIRRQFRGQRWIICLLEFKGGGDLGALLQGCLQVREHCYGARARYVPPLT